MRKDFLHKRIVITGGSRGLGFALAQRFAHEGALVTILARSEADLNRAASKLGSNARAIVCDVRDPAQVKRAFADIGRVDILLNVAGVLQVSPIEQVTIGDFEDCMQTNFWGPLRTIHEVLPQMKERKRGQIVNVASFGGLVGLPTLLPYTASKHALVGMSESLAAEMRRFGVHVMTVNPGIMRSGGHVRMTSRGHHKLLYAGASLIYSSPIAQSADNVANTIVKAMRRRQTVLDLTVLTRILRIAEALAPNLLSRVMSVAARVMPGPTEDNRLHQASESHSLIAPSLLSALADQKAVELNEA